MAVWRHFTGGFIWAVLAFSAVEAKEPQRLALLAGASNYPVAAVGDLQLTGPKFDVALMMDTMERAGFAAQDMIVLADGLEETDAKRKADGLPTHAAILDALKKLAKRASSGDTVLIYLSGHGSQQPDLNPGKRPFPKPDNLDEIFLPLDIGAWTEEIQALPNALADFELGQAVNAIRAKGALVWVVIDACHSGTMTRSTAAGQMVKQVPPARLGIPQSAFDKAKASAAPRQTTRSWGFEAKPATRSLAAEGGYVAFFAAYPDQSALQENLPKSYGPNPDKKPHGVLTYYLAQAMRSGHAANFRDLAHQILAGYGQFGAKAPTPMFEGDLGAAMPGAAAQNGQMRFPVHVGDEISIDAGALDGLSVGTIIALSAPDAPKQVKAYGSVETVSATKASLKPVEYGGLPAELPKAALLVGSVAAKGLELTLRIAKPAASEAAKPVLAALEGLTGPVEFVAEGQPADMSLRVEDGRIWLIPENGNFEKAGRERTPSIELSGDIKPKLEALFGGLAKVKNLIKAADAMETSALNSVSIEEYLLRDAGGASDDRACPAIDKDHLPPNAEKIDGSALVLPRLGHCDTVYFALTNIGEKPVDLTPLYVDGGGGIAYMGPKEGLRLEPKAAARLVPIPIRTWDRKANAPYPVGQERLLFIAAEVDGRQAFTTNYAYLAQPTLTRASPSHTPLGQFLEAAAFGAKTRAVAAPGNAGASGIFSFRWNVVAP